MARCDEVTLFGQVQESPRILRAKSDDPESPVLRVIVNIAVLRGIRPYGARDGRMKLDILPLMSGQEKTMVRMSSWEAGDIVLVRGQLITQDHPKSCVCPACGHVQTYPSYTAYIYPFYTRLIAQGYDQERGLIELKNNREISNRIIAIGTACDKPIIHQHEKSGNYITSYVIDISRKYHVKEDADSNRHDFPVVKSYGENAQMDHHLIEKGGMVLLDGQLQSRTYTRTFICEQCGGDIQKLDNVVEIVPYSTEYLEGCYAVDQYDDVKAQAEAKELEDFKHDLFGSDARSENDEVIDTNAAE